MPAQSSAPFDIPVPTAFARTSDDVRQASEKMLNVWVGAATPLWAPFFAATSFGVGTWAIMQAMQRHQDLFKDMSPLGLWQASERMTEVLLGSTDTTPTAAVKAASKAVDALSRSEAVVEATTSVMNQTIGMATKTIETVTQAAAEEVKAVSKLVSADLIEDKGNVVILPTASAVPVPQPPAPQPPVPKPASRRRPARKT